MDIVMLKSKKFMIFVLTIIIVSGVSNNTYAMQVQRNINKQSERQLKKTKKTDYVYLSPAANFELRSAAVLHNVRVERYKQEEQKKQKNKTILCCIPFKTKNT